MARLLRSLTVAAAFALGALGSEILLAFAGVYVLGRGPAAASPEAQLQLDLWIHSSIAIAASVFFFAGFVLRFRTPLEGGPLLIALTLGLLFPLPSLALMVYVSHGEGPTIILPMFELIYILCAPIFFGLRLAQWSSSRGVVGGAK